jgi:putative addiction module killer protein
MYTIDHYLNPDNGQNLFEDWLAQMRDRVAKLAILKRIVRIEEGNFGDHKFCREGVSELRVNVGAGYRVYYAMSGKQVVLLLCGGDKRTQDADIDRACDNWRNWQILNKENLR